MIAVLERLVGSPCRPAVIVTTGGDVLGNRERVTALGGSDCLLRPVDESPLIAAIARNLRPAPTPA
jgi:FixJ family two-component response regulator